ncbi:carbohydrate ABC transporter permease [Microbacterium gorillae]|uniref:carbohydrate ABC transporter permease n=1 Tax=Microbacterium gorillae TaxID=1231063 RepID=UPI000B179523|nr:carbohydrate ABC transporter permease [Microbacterium gorillae]
MSQTRTILTGTGSHPTALRHRRTHPSTVIRVVVLVVLGIIWLLPTYLLIVNAAKDPTTFTSKTAWAVTDFHLFQNFGAALELSGLAGSVLSTLLYAILSPAIAVLVGAAAGFAIVALHLRHGFAWFVFIFGGTIFPLQMILLPLFDGYSRTGLFDTRTGMVIVYTAISIPFSAFVMRNFFTGIAHSIFEAAVLDGATTWRIFLRMYLPMASSALVAIFILQATFVWNDLLLGLTLSQSDDIRPIITTLSGMQSTYGGAQMSTVLAAAVLVSLPTVILFLATQRFFSRGLALGQT